ncbi:hypothetical protein ACIQGZ_02670 [Streptomyces sp. NPDC092296]|uniref:hypothetical protein n=1 Tax=Streptomyces sp. NPDC092296 TaxID=3366012 RepID=UPI0037FAF636
MTAPPPIRPLAAAHLRDALTALAGGDRPTAVAALMSIDAESWHGIDARLAWLGADFAALITLAAAEGVR